MIRIPTMTRRARLTAPISAVALLAVVGLTGCSNQATDETTSTAPAAVPAPTTAGATPVSLTYSVGGLHCEGCVSGVNATVAAIPGVSACDVSLEEGRMVVQVDSPATGMIVADAVRRMNYTVAPLPADPAADAAGPTEG
jgi:copper chaperone CopZ